MPKELDKVFVMRVDDVTLQTFITDPASFDDRTQSSWVRYVLAACLDPAMDLEGVVAWCRHKQQCLASKLPCDCKTTTAEREIVRRARRIKRLLRFNE